MDQPRRRDAVRNRALIVAAAHEEVAASGALVLSAVVRRAGIGQGTLYRHFPTREALLVEVYRVDVDALVAAAADAARDLAPLPALRRWFAVVAAHATVKHGVFAAVEASVSADLAASSHGAVHDALADLLAAARADGSVRPDVQARDVLLLMSPLGRLGPDEAAERSPRLLDVVLRGLLA